MFRLVLALSISAVFSASALAQKEAKPVPTNLAPDTYSIYSAIYQSSDGMLPDEVIAVAHEAEWTRKSLDCAKPQSSEEKKLVKNFLKENKEPHQWDAAFTMARPVQLLDPPEIDAAHKCMMRPMNDPDCQDFRYYRFVRYFYVPSFNHDRTVALVGLGQTCAATECGNQFVALYKKTHSSWALEENSFVSACTWMY